MNTSDANNFSCNTLTGFLNFSRQDAKQSLRKRLKNALSQKSIRGLFTK